MTVWQHSQFVKFFKTSPRKAFEYRKECLWDEIPEEYMTDEEKKAVKPAKATKTAPVSVETPKEDTIQVKEVETAPTDAEIVETLSIEDMRNILDKNNIEYSHLAKEKGLMKKLEENKLI